MGGEDSMSIKRRAAADAMRALTSEQRSEAIAAADNVIDKRAFFEDRKTQVALSRVYRRPGWRDGGAA